MIKRASTEPEFYDSGDLVAPLGRIPKVHLLQRSPSSTTRVTLIKDVEALDKRATASTEPEFYDSGDRTDAKSNPALEVASTEPEFYDSGDASRNLPVVERTVDRFNGARVLRLG